MVKHAFVHAHLQLSVEINILHGFLCCRKWLKKPLPYTYCYDTHTWTFSPAMFTVLCTEKTKTCFLPLLIESVQHIECKIYVCMPYNHMHKVPLPTYIPIHSSEPKCTDEHTYTYIRSCTWNAVHEKYNYSIIILYCAYQRWLCI